jgi:hypothetical protein
MRLVELASVQVGNRNICFLQTEEVGMRMRSMASAGIISTPDSSLRFLWEGLSVVLATFVYFLGIPAHWKVVTGSVTTKLTTVNS